MSGQVLKKIIVISILYKKVLYIQFCQITTMGTILELFYTFQDG